MMIRAFIMMTNLTFVEVFKLEIVMYFSPMELELTVVAGCSSSCQQNHLQSSAPPP